MNKEAHILLVEDSFEHAFLAKAMFKKSHTPLKISVAVDGVEALDFMYTRGKYKDAESPDLVLLDLNLPRKDGREVLKELRDDKAFKDTPIVILSTSSNPEDMRICKEFGCDHYYTKPLSVDRFLEIVSEIDNRWLKPAIS